MEGRDGFDWQGVGFGFNAATRVLSSNTGGAAPSAAMWLPSHAVAAMLAAATGGIGIHQHRDAPADEEGDRRAASQMLIDGLEEFQHPIQVQAQLFGHADSRSGR